MGRSTVQVLQGFGILTEHSDGTFTAERVRTAKDMWSFCPDERFADQLIMDANAFCSGFLITSKWIGTAAHCALADEEDYLIVFGFELTSESETRLEFSADDVYKVDKIVAVGTPGGKLNDYGILQLDRKVVGYKPYTKINHQTSIGDPLTLIGYPTGLPKKTDKSGQVTVNAPLILRGTVDSYGGNSGSPVFDHNGLLVGILVGGSDDFVDDGHWCKSSNICPDRDSGEKPSEGSGCEELGEYIVPICVLIESSEEVAAEINIDCQGEQPETVFTYDYSNSSVLTASILMFLCLALV